LNWFVIWLILQMLVGFFLFKTYYAFIFQLVTFDVSQFLKFLARLPDSLYKAQPPWWATIRCAAMSFKNGYRYQPDWQYAWRRTGVSQPGCLQPLSWHYLVECSTVYDVWQESLKQRRPRRRLRLHRQQMEEL
jgi:hypothetical protein